jgi:F0F1-type ATP synthase membrane subunit b/b'
MNTFLFFTLIVILGYTSFVFTNYLKQNIKYKEARSAEIKRRLQVEHKQEQNLEQLLKSPMDDREKAKLVAKFARERHQRQIYYVIQDSLERWQ